MLIFHEVQSWKRLIRSSICNTWLAGFGNGGVHTQWWFKMYTQLNTTFLTFSYIHSYLSLSILSIYIFYSFGGIRLETIRSLPLSPLLRTALKLFQTMIFITFFYIYPYKKLHYMLHLRSTILSNYSATIPHYRDGTTRSKRR